MHLTKHHGLGNDFLVLVDETGSVPVEALGSDVVRWVCDRRRGVGADGFIQVGPGTSGADVSMVLRNADGSRAEMSGNGIRCLGQAVARARALDELALNVATDGGLRRLQIRFPPGERDAAVEVDMGSAEPGPAVKEVRAGVAAIKSTTVDMGNPHLVVLVEDHDNVDVAALGVASQRDYPSGINVEVISMPAGGNDVVDLVVWERGVGLTQACGTGACAAAYAAHQWGLVEDRVSVRMPGGKVDVFLGPSIMLDGPATFVADVEVAL